eukprot:GHVU01166531.1.p1 GENE.GHVU01166531.1~~GHVU01166531.1.p1  ORF type:complete len:546 (+),score=50.24 GHVU01166531.1:96-1640(+)
MRDKAEDEGWKLAQHFKLHLHPKSMKATQTITLDPLPFDVTLEKIYADLMRYLFEQTRTFFQQRIVDGTNTWQKHEATIQFVMAHPNGWGFLEQAFLRRAAVSAGLVPPDLKSRDRIQFVTEGEASVHFVLVNTDLQNKIQPGVELIVCDAGGSTVDTTLYTVATVDPVLKLKEKRASGCVQAGAIFVNQSAKAYFSRIFSNAELDEEDVQAYTEEAVESFEDDAKKGFVDSSKDYHISVGGRGFTDPKLRVRKGLMALKGSQVQLFFAPWVAQIIESAENQLEGHSVKYILLVGGFGDSPYLRSMFREGPGERGIEITLANDSTAKAVADGGIIWYAKNAVTSRATRFAYGTETLVDYNPKLSEHQGRNVRETLGGATVSGGWSQIIAKDTVIDDKEDTNKTYFRMFATANPSLSLFEETIYAYSGPLAKPTFIMTKSGDIDPHFHKVGVVKADMTGKQGALQRVTTKGQTYWRLPFKVALRFGTTELRASIEWKEQGQTKKGPATIVPLDSL